MAAFYYPWYFTPEFDGVWEHWEGNPPEDIASDFYPLLGPYSMSNPEVLAQHFAWLREAGVGLIISSWWGKFNRTDTALPLMLDIADHYGIKVAFHIEPYSGRTANNLMRDIRYIYDQYGSHPAFYWTTDTSRYSPGDQPKGLFFLWATVVPDNDKPPVAHDYWKDALDTLHSEDPGAIVITDQNDPAWVIESHFDGSYNYGVLDADQVGYNWARALPLDTWYIPGINPGFSAKRIGGETWVDTPRRDGATYQDRWERMFEMGIEPALVAVTTFNEWHEGTQIEPAVPGKTRLVNTYPYLDYAPLEPEAYLEMTRDWSEVFLAYEWPESSTARLLFRTTSDWTDLHLVSGAAWIRPELISVSEDATMAEMVDGYIAIGQPLNLAEAGNTVEVTFQLQFQEGETDDPLIFMIERGGLGASWVELYYPSGEDWILADSFWWAGHNAGPRNTANFEVPQDAIFREGP
jgi:glycoprotein endo-alpha-1,2-mannosidase